VEDVQRVQRVVLQTQAWQIGPSCGWPVDATEVDYKPIVDEHPHVVVASEGQGAGAVVSKGCVYLRAKVEVVTVALVAPAFFVNWKEVAVVVMKFFRIILDQRDGLSADHLIHSRNVIEPLCESGAGWHKVRGWPVRVATALGLAVWANVVLDKAQLHVERPADLEIEVRLLEIIVGDIQCEDGRWRRRRR